MNRNRVVIDYGHGGQKVGACYGGIEEKHVNLLTGECIRQRLHSYNEPDKNIQVMLTRDSDYHIPLTIRFELINRHHARNPIDLCVSVHHNACGKESVKGFEVYYADTSTNGKRAAQYIIDSVKDAGVEIHHGGLITTKQLGRRLAMIHRVVPPAILLEIGYLTNPEDLAHCQDSDQRQKVASAISKGIWNYLEEKNG